MKDIRGTFAPPLPRSTTSPDEVQYNEKGELLEEVSIAFSDEQGLVDALLKEATEIRIGNRRVSILNSAPFHRSAGWPTLEGNPELSSMVICNGSGCPPEGIPKGGFQIIADLDRWSQRSLKLLYSPVPVTIPNGIGNRVKPFAQGSWVAVGNGRPGGKVSLWTAVYVPPRAGQAKGTLGIVPFSRLGAPLPQPRPLEA